MQLILTLSTPKELDLYYVLDWENFSFAIKLIKIFCNIIFITCLDRFTVEPRFNEPLYNEVLGITNDIFQPSNSVMYGKEPRYNEPSI